MAELLETIAVAVGTAILSDLHQNTAIRERIPHALQRIPPGVFPLKAWQDATRYILSDNTLTPETECEVRGLFEQKQIIGNISRRQKI